MKMNFKPSIIFLVVATLSVVASQHKSIVNVQDLLARSNANNCFGGYNKYMADLTSKYNKKHNVCEEASKQKQSAIEAANEEKRTALAAIADNSCNAVTSCNVNKTVEGSFECYNAQGIAATATFHSAQLTASNNLKDLQEAKRVVQNEQYKCGNSTNDEFQIEMLKCNTYLTQCMTSPVYVWPSVAESA